MDIKKLLPYRSPPSVAVIGDICLDLYYFTDNAGAEVSVETGLQSYSVYKTKLEGGGAGNVAVNCKKLEAKRVDIYGLAGDDCWGVILRDVLTQNGINTEGMLVQKENWQTHVYHKIYDGKNELPRCDMGIRNILLDTKADEIIALLESKLDTYECVIINEQVPSGIHSGYFQKKLAALIEANRDRVTWFSDCRKLNDRYAHTIRKLNVREAEQILAGDGVFVQDSGDPCCIANRLYERWGYPVVLTMSEEGALVMDETGCKTINSIHFSTEIDIVGAGDAFLAGLVTGYGAGLSLYEAAMIGTYSAGVCLGKLFETGHPGVDEVIALADDCDFNYNPRLAADESLARYAEGTEIEIVTDAICGRNSCRLKTAIFDHDGTISVLRQGREEVMYAMKEKHLTMVQQGMLDTADVTIKGSVDFLKKLAASGTKLYLVSGADQEDVIQEAQLLGYADIFSGGIRGSVGDIKNDPKKIVIRSIITEIEAGGGRPEEVAVFGDGPVEMREAKKAGFLAVGILSDEHRRWGRNPDKRKRLILGGADLLIPDFSMNEELIKLCGWE